MRMRDSLELFTTYLSDIANQLIYGLLIAPAGNNNILDLCGFAFLTKDNCGEEY
jgi:hypothetical protein